MAGGNLLSTAVSVLQLAPGIIHRPLQSRLLGWYVPFVGTSGLCVEEMTRERVVVSISNRRRTRNHIKGVHAAAMALIAETATGFVVAMNLPGDKVPLIKSLKVEYKRRTRGSMRAVAVLDERQRSVMAESDRGETPVEVHVTDESGEEPITCEMVWAWVPRRR